MRLVKAASAVFAQTDPTSAHKAARDQHLKDKILEFYRESYPEKSVDSKILDGLISELLDTPVSELYLAYMRHAKSYPELVQHRRYRAALSHTVATVMSKTATFYSRYGGLHHDQDVTRIEPQDTGSVRTTMPQEPVDGKPTFSPGREELMFSKRRRKGISNHAHMHEDPQTPNVDAGRPSMNVDEMNNPGRGDSRDFESL